MSSSCTSHAIIYVKKKKEEDLNDLMNMRKKNIKSGEHKIIL